MLNSALADRVAEDLPSVKWHQVTESTKTLTEHFSGSSSTWVHTVIIRKDGTNEICQGTATAVAYGFIVRYTPKLTEQVLRLLNKGGHRGGTTKEAT